MSDAHLNILLLIILCECVYIMLMCMCVCMWSPESNSECLPQSLSILLFKIIS